MCARAATVPSCSGFTIGQICGIMCAALPSSALATGRANRTVGYVDSRNDWSKVIDFKGIC